MGARRCWHEWRRAIVHSHECVQGGAAYDAFMEQENDAKIGALGDKVSELRALTIQIGNHVKADNQELDALNGSFDSARGSSSANARSCMQVAFSRTLAGAGSILAGTMKRLGGLTSSKDSRHMLYLVVFVVVVLLLVYKLSRH